MAFFFSPSRTGKSSAAGNGAGSESSTLADLPSDGGRPPEPAADSLARTLKKAPPHPGGAPAAFPPRSQETVQARMSRQPALDFSAVPENTAFPTGGTTPDDAATMQAAYRRSTASLSRKVSHALIPGLKSTSTRQAAADPDKNRKAARWFANALQDMQQASVPPEATVNPSLNSWAEDFVYAWTAEEQCAATARILGSSDAGEVRRVATIARTSLVEHGEARDLRRHFNGAAGALDDLRARGALSPAEFFVAHGALFPSRRLQAHFREAPRTPAQAPRPVSSRLSYAVLAVDGPGLLVDFALASIGRSLDEVEYTLENRRANARQVAEWMAPVEPHLDAIDRGRLKSHFQELLDGASRNCPVENVFQVAMNCSGIAPALRERMNREGVGPESRLAMKMRHQWNEAMELVGRLTHVLGFEEWDPLENLVQPQGQDFMAMADAGRHLLSLEHPDFEPVPAPREILRRAMEASGIDGDRVAALLLSLD